MLRPKDLQKQYPNPVQGTTSAHGTNKLPPSHREQEADRKSISAMTETAVSSSSSTGFNDLPGEVRNMIYHIFFESLLASTATVGDSSIRPINHDKIDYIPAHVFKPIIGLFLASHQISKESRGLYYATYFPRRHYLLRSRESIYSFSRLPSHWAQTLHRIHLTAQGVPQGRKILNPVKVALLKAARADQSSLSTHLEPCKLSLSDNDQSWRVVALRRVFKAKLTLGSLPIKLKVCCVGNNMEVKFVGPLGKLDWTLVPLMRYTEKYAMEQSKARRTRVLQTSKGRIPLRQIPTDLSQLEPHVEWFDAAPDAVTEMAEELVQAMGLQLPEKKTWAICLT